MNDLSLEKLIRKVLLEQSVSPGPTSSSANNDPFGGTVDDEQQVIRTDANSDEAAAIIASGLNNNGMNFNPDTSFAENVELVTSNTQQVDQSKIDKLVEDLFSSWVGYAFCTWGVVALLGYSGLLKNISIVGPFLDSLAKWIANPFKQPNGVKPNILNKTRRTVVYFFNKGTGPFIDDMKLVPDIITRINRAADALYKDGIISRRQLEEFKSTYVTTANVRALIKEMKINAVKEFKADLKAGKMPVADFESWCKTLGIEQQPWVQEILKEMKSIEKAAADIQSARTSIKTKKATAKTVIGKTASLQFSTYKFKNDIQHAIDNGSRTFKPYETPYDWRNDKSKKAELTYGQTQLKERINNILTRDIQFPKYIQFPTYSDWLEEVFINSPESSMGKYVKDKGVTHTAQNSEKLKQIYASFKYIWLYF